MQNNKPIKRHMRESIEVLSEAVQTTAIVIAAYGKTSVGNDLETTSAN